MPLSSFYPLGFQEEYDTHWGRLKYGRFTLGSSILAFFAPDWSPPDH